MSIAASLLALPLLLAPQVGNSFDIVDLVRKLFAGRSVEGASASPAIRMRDEAGSKRLARLRFVEDGTGGVLLTVELVSQREPLFPHTLRLQLGDSTTEALRILDLQEGAADESELVLAPVSSEQLERIADATSLQLTLQGWDETFRGSVDAKGMKRIREFRDVQRANS